MSKSSSIWECQSCGSQFPRWSGQCPECGKWNSLVESIAFSKSQTSSSKPQRNSKLQYSKPEKLSEILKNVTTSRRVSTQIGELDRVLGGPPAGEAGMVPGSVMLLAGEPGMGKSTLLSQAALAIANSKCKIQNAKLNVAPAALYICGEESPSQVAMRLQRLGGSRPPAGEAGLTNNDLPARNASHSEAGRRITLLSETNVDVIISALLTMKQFNNEAIVVIDSIQTLHTDDLSGMAGSVGQIRECAGRLSQIAKQFNIPLFLIGHITKEGEIAGPKVLEHMVDVVLTLEGDRTGNLRFVRAVKNRFGPVDEVGLFSMEENGMNEVANPAELLIGEQAGQASGSVLGCIMEGQRPLAIEVQALTVPSKIPVPRRIGHGIRIQKLQLLSAVIEKHLGLGIGDKDVYVNVAGGLTSQDPGLDLAIVAAIVSSLSCHPAQVAGFRRNQRDPSTRRGLLAQDDRKPVIFCGEVGLLGEIRQVQGWSRREKEIKRLKVGKLIGKDSVRHIRELQKYLK